MYLVSVGVITLDMNETGGQELSGCKLKNYPTKTKVGSISCSLIPLFGLYRAMEHVWSQMLSVAHFLVPMFPLRKFFCLFLPCQRCTRKTCLSWFTMPRIDFAHRSSDWAFAKCPTLEHLLHFYWLDIVSSGSVDLGTWPLRLRLGCRVFFFVFMTFFLIFFFFFFF